MSHAADGFPQLPPESIMLDPENIGVIVKPKTEERVRDLAQRVCLWETCRRTSGAVSTGLKNLPRFWGGFTWVGGLRNGERSIEKRKRKFCRKDVRNCIPHCIFCIIERRIFFVYVYVYLHICI